MKQVFIYKRFERFWHWTQATLIIMMAITGFEIHGFFHLIGFEQAVVLHDTLAWALIILVVFAIFWHLTTGEWKQYIPTTDKLLEQARYYGGVIFKHEDHPVHKTELSKLNPLQRLTYLGFKLMILPVLGATGLLYMYRDYWDGWVIAAPLKLVAFTHTAMAFALISFLIVHVYMTTTGHTLTSNIQAMITGWEELEEGDEGTGQLSASGESVSI